MFVSNRARRRPRAFATRSGSRTRHTTWATYSGNSVVLGTGLQTAPIDLLANLELSGIGILGATILRTHLRMGYSSTTADTGPGVYAGLFIEDSTLISATAPNVKTDLERDYMMWQFQDPGLARNSMVDGTSILWGEEWDLRTKRILHQANDKMYLALFNNSSGNLTYSVAARILLSLP
jgi:hypothetical protein